MYKTFNNGMIEIITGPMFSGKSEELLRRLRTLEYAKFTSLVIKPDFDTRFSNKKIVSRAGNEHITHTIKDIEEIYDLLKEKNYNAILIDEAHFFSNKLVDVANELANKGYLVIVAGLDLNFKMQPFENIAHLMALAERVTKLQAVCMVCQHAASTSFRKVKVDEVNFLGDHSEYEARCRKCDLKGEAEKAKIK